MCLCLGVAWWGGLWGITQGSALQLQVWGSFAHLPTPAMWGGNGGREGPQPRQKIQGPGTIRPDSVIGMRDIWRGRIYKGQIPSRGCRPLRERWSTGQRFLEDFLHMPGVDTLLRAQAALHILSSVCKRDAQYHSSVVRCT